MNYSMKKTLDTTHILSDLRESSIFFRREPAPSPTPEPQPESENVSKETSFQGNKETNQQGNKETNHIVSKETKKQRNKETKRYATYLTVESIKAIKRLAFEIDKKDYELVQDAVDKYLKKMGY